MNLPIYRANRIDSDEYVVGFYVDTVDFLTKTLKNKNGYITKNGSFHIIDISTLSIHLPDMLDIQGNKIFASLSEDGKGGDIVEYNGKKEVVKYSIGTIQTYMFRFEDLIDLNIKVIGIQQ